MKGEYGYIVENHTLGKVFKYLDTIDIEAMSLKQWKGHRLVVKTRKGTVITKLSSDKAVSRK